jgi:hypothetical protein
LAIAEARLVEALSELEPVRDSDPADARLASDADCARELARKLDAAEKLGDAERPAALLAVARELERFPEPWASLRRGLLCRVADELARQGGDAGTLERRPPGYYFLEGGAPEKARRSLERAITEQPRSGWIFLLADAHVVLDDTRAARRLYLEALLCDPFDPAFDTIRDQEVASLVDVARYELELTEAPAAWSAPVGMVTGVLPVSAATAALSRITTQPRECRTATELAALERARAFAKALAAAMRPDANREQTVAARQSMKENEPRLFAAYMQRLARSRSGQG